jgi:hypothetical protein
MEPAEPIPTDRYPDADFPWTFYFNGHPMPRWAACWGLARIRSFLQIEEQLDQEVNHTEVYIVACCVDHVGRVESEDPDVFLYAIQEVLIILLRDRETVQKHLSESPDYNGPAIYEDLLEGAFLMRELVLVDRRAFWTSGYEEDRQRLVQTMDTCASVQPGVDAQMAPHAKRRRSQLELLTTGQLRELRKLSYDKLLAPPLRTRLQAL